MKPHHLYWLWIIVTVPMAAVLDKIYLAPILAIFPPIIFGWSLVVGPSDEKGRPND